MMTLILLAFLSGGTRVLSRQANSLLTQKTSILFSTLMNYISGLTLSVIVYLILPKFNLPTLTTLPLWIFTGGLIGIVSVSMTSYLSVKLTQLSFSVLLLSGQLLGSLLLDFTLGQSIHPIRALGVFVILLAALLQMSSKNQVA